MRPSIAVMLGAKRTLAEEALDVRPPKAWKRGFAQPKRSYEDLLRENRLLQAEVARLSKELERCDGMRRVGWAKYYEIKQRKV